MATSVFSNSVKKLNFSFRLLCVLAFAVIVESRGKKTYDMIYEDITGGVPCIRRMNATHQIGCTSEFSGNTGVIHVIDTEEDISWLETTGPHAPYMVVLSAEIFTRPNIEKLIRSKKVNGMVVDYSNDTRRSFIDADEGYSPDQSCPNDQFGLYADTEYANCTRVKWNPWGDGTNFDYDFDIPVFVLTKEDDVTFLKDCYWTHNHRNPNNSEAADYPLCAIELRDFMHGVKDTPTCMFRTERMTNLEPSSYCDPIGDKNVWGFAKNSEDTSSSSYQSVILAAAQLDATSLFYSTLPPLVGSESVVSSLVTLLGAAEAIGNLSAKEKESWDHDIMFTFFNGESYDYIGSSRMVYDMMRGYFPNNPEKKDPPKSQLPQMNITNIAYYMELRQLGLADGSAYYAHVDPISQKNEEIHNKTEEIIEALLASQGDIRVSPVMDAPLPPASLQQFLRTGVNIPGVLLTDHKTEYKNKFYNSRYDIPYYVGVDKWDDDTVVIQLAKDLNKVATTVAKALVSLAGGNNENVKTDEKMVNQLLYCFLVNMNCTLFRSLQDNVNPKISAIGVNLYTGVDILDTQGSKTTNTILSYFLGEKTEMKKEEKAEKCKKPEDNSVYNYLFVLGPKMSEDEGICIKSTVHKTAAVSPAFIDDEHTKPDWASTKYSTWTESQWANSPFSIRVFLVPSPQQEWLLFSLGALVVVISFPSVYFIHARADILFRT